MIRYLLALLLFAAPALAQDSPLEIKGDGVQTIKIDRVITIKEDALAATKFPIFFRAPADAIAFRWTIPSGITYSLSDNEDVATITAAPGGTINIFVVAKIVDWDAKKVISKKFTGKILITGVPDPTPKPPPSPPAPDDTLLQKLAAAWQQESDTDRAAVRDNFIRVYSRAAKASAPDASPLAVTTGDLMAVIQVAHKEYQTANRLPSLQRAILAEVNTVLLNSPSVLLTNEDRTKANALFNRLCIALAALK